VGAGWWFRGRKRRIVVLGALLYAVLWGFTWLWGCPGARAELVSMHRRYGNQPSFTVTCVQSDLVAAGVPPSSRPANWWHVGRAVSPAPFVVWINHAVEGPGRGYGAIRWYFWCCGYLGDLREVILWRSEQRGSKVTYWPDADE